ncbi:FAD-dependent monooxygenase [Siccirubricoccus deserti]|uniref:FAD-dependent monooxygenase n=1 Tax=Siccirubricoccus deserti TaxID=2013562 RepID=A0A9X0UG80_9PROT|nr:FAD-dependent monooxygenase [Siccirubricoccus deserti]
MIFTGDAAHLVPVFGSGPNFGTDDAGNLAWELAAAMGGESLASLLDSYSAEIFRAREHPRRPQEHAVHDPARPRPCAAAGGGAVAGGGRGIHPRPDQSAAERRHRLPGLGVADIGAVRMVRRPARAGPCRASRSARLMRRYWSAAPNAAAGAGPCGSGGVVRRTQVAGPGCGRHRAAWLGGAGRGVSGATGWACRLALAGFRRRGASRADEALNDGCERY